MIPARRIDDVTPNNAFRERPIQILRLRPGAAFALDDMAFVHVGMASGQDHALMAILESMCGSDAGAA
ncbi:MAG: hypothetical protein HQ478_13985 [Chloroflexi bacterium]|nr:hypothetical protein [Chloroflexota bacterium]